jgi:hypothetical protein
MCSDQIILVAGHANGPPHQIKLFAVDVANKGATELPCLSATSIKRQISVYQDIGKVVSWNYNHEGDLFAEVIDLDLPEDIDTVELRHKPIFGGYRISRQGEDHVISCGKNGRFEMERVVLNDSISTPVNISDVDANDFLLNCRSDPYSGEGAITLQFDQTNHAFLARFGDSISKLKVLSNADMIDYIKSNEPILQLFVNDPRITVIRGIRRAHGMKGVVFFCYSKPTSIWKMIVLDGGYSSMALYGDYLVLKKEKYIDSSVDELRSDHPIIAATNGHKGYQTIPTGEYEFYDLNLEFKHRLNLSDDAEILAVNEDALYYKISDELYRSNLNDPSHEELLCVGDGVKQSHWIYFR